MTFLHGIWSVSIGLAAISLLVMGTLIVRRIASDLTASKRSARRNALITLILDAVDQIESQNKPKLALEPGDLPVLDDVVGELLDLVTGSSRDHLIELLRTLGMDRNARQRLTEGDASERIRAAQTLGLFKDDATAQALRRALDDPISLVRLAVAEALVKIDGRISATELVAKLRIGAERPSRQLRTIFRSIAAPQFEALRALLGPESPTVVRMLAIDALAHSDDYRAVDVILAISNDPVDDVRAEALRGLTVLEHPAALPAVQRGLADPSWPVRLQAARCAGRIGFSETAPTLIRLLEDDMWWVRYRAAEALVALGGDALAALRDAAATPSRAGRTAQLVLAEKAAA